jgi:colicin import membrane protein
MEEPVKSKQWIVAVLAALVVVSGMLGCTKKDDTAVKALQELTNQQLEAVKASNEELTKIAGEIEDCQAEVAKTKGEPAVIKTKDVTVETPELVGEASVESLEALKAAIAETTKKQATALSELTAAKEACDADLAEAEEAAEAALAEADAAAAAAADAKAAAQEAAAKKKAAAARRAKRKPKAVKEAEAQGKPSTGVRSRY